jgi:hypothetical protein
MAKTEHRWVGTHVQDLADGRMLAIGEFVELDDEDLKDPHNARLIEEGLLVPSEQAEAKKTTAHTAKKTEGDSE